MLLNADHPLAELYDLALVDLDGVAYRGREPIEHAAAGLAGARRAGMGVVFVTNNASREPESVAEQLRGLDIPSLPDDVMTAAQAAASMLSERLAPGAKVLVVGGSGLVTAVRAVGLEVVTSADDEPAAVVQGFAPDVGWRELAQASYAIQRGAWFVASNLDRTLPNEHGFAPGNGALVEAVRLATGVDPVSAGKPEPMLYRLAVARRGGQNPLVVGDRLDTDLGGAHAAGYPGLHVLTGVSDARDAVLAPPEHRPAYVGADLRSLLVAHAAPVRDDDAWTAGANRAHVHDGSLVLEGPENTLDAVRVACAAVWDASDRGAAIDRGSVPVLTVSEG